MDGSSEFAEMYQDIFEQTKLDREHDEQQIEDIHARFGYFGDEQKMANKIKDKRFDLAGAAQDTEDEVYTTDFDVDADPEDAELYRRYKIMQVESKMDQNYYDEQVDIMARSVKAYKEGDRARFMSLRRFWDIKQELMDKKFARKTFEMEIENHLAQIRVSREINKLNPMQLTVNDMGVQDKEFGAQTGFVIERDDVQQARADTSLPTQLRQMLGRATPELQNVYMPVFDESSRQEFIDVQELKNRLFEAKWDWYKAQKLGQTKVVTKEMAEEATIADDHDKWMTRRVEFMYDYLDFDNERA